MTQYNKYNILSTSEKVEIFLSEGWTMIPNSWKWKWYFWKYNIYKVCISFYFYLYFALYFVHYLRIDLADSTFVYESHIFYAFLSMPDIYTSKQYQDLFEFTIVYYCPCNDPLGIQINRFIIEFTLETKF